jgi:hypothetical protein
VSAATALTAHPGLSGLRAGSPQVMGAFRIVPLLRESAPGDLRIGKEAYDAYGVVRLDGVAEEPGLSYMSYVPHGLVIAHTHDGSEATLGASLLHLGRDKPRRVKLHHRMVKARAAEDGSARFRMLPLHLAMEGFLALHFRGPDILWQEYSEQAARRGLDPRRETSVRGAWLAGFEDAVRLFEIHEHQVGVLVFVADALATVFVVSHPDDYRKLHLSLLEDFFGELLYTYALLYPESPRAESRIDPRAVTDLDHLAREMDRVRTDFRHYTELLTQGLFGRPAHTDTVRDLGAFTLQRFYPDFDPREECHIGEQILRRDGTVEYMKTFRLSHAQVRRAYLLEKLAAAEWDLDRAMVLLGAASKTELLKRIVNAGFGYLLKPHLLRGLPIEPGVR